MKIEFNRSWTRLSLTRAVTTLLF